MKTANDLYQYINSLWQKGKDEVVIDTVHIRIYSTTTAKTIKFSVGLDRYAQDIGIDGTVKTSGFCGFNVYPHMPSELHSFHVFWSSNEDWDKLLAKCPTGKNIQTIAKILQEYETEEEI